MWLTEQGKIPRETPGFSTLPFTVMLIGLEFLMDRGFSCPCDPGLNAILISFIFLGPSLLALTVMVFNLRPCRRKLPRFTDVSFGLIVPALWIFLLLFDGDYVACGLVYWEGDYVLNEALQMKWCKPTRGNRTDLLELTEKIIFYSRTSTLALLSLVSITVTTTVIYSDWNNRPSEPLEERQEVPQQTSLSDSEAEENHPSV